MSTAEAMVPGDSLEVTMAGLACLLNEATQEIAEAAKKIETVLGDVDTASQTQKLDALLAVCTVPSQIQEATYAVAQELLALAHVAQAARIERLTTLWWHRWRWPGVAVLACLLGVGIGGYGWSPSANQRAWSHLGAQLDAVLMTQYGNLSTGLQGLVSKIYGQCGLQSPAERRGKRA